MSPETYTEASLIRSAIAKLEALKAITELPGIALAIELKQTVGDTVASKSNSPEVIAAIGIEAFNAIVGDALANFITEIDNQLAAKEAEFLAL